MTDKAELAAGILLTVLVAVIVVPGLILAIIQGCFGKRRSRKEKEDGQGLFRG